MRSLRLPQWSRTPISVDIRVGLIHQKTMGNGINWWQWSSALQTMAHKHPLTSGQMWERRGGGWARVWRIACEHVRLCLCVWVHTCESDRGRGSKGAVTEMKWCCRLAGKMARKISPRGWYKRPTRYLWRKKTSLLWVSVQTFHSSF